MTWYEYFNLIVMDILRFLARFSTGLGPAPTRRRQILSCEHRAEHPENGRLSQIPARHGGIFDPPHLKTHTKGHSMPESPAAPPSVLDWDEKKPPTSASAPCRRMRDVEPRCPATPLILFSCALMLVVKAVDLAKDYLFKLVGDAMPDAVRTQDESRIMALIGGAAVPRS